MPTGPLPAFATLLRELRRAARLTQEELAGMAHVGVRTLRDLETGRTARPQRSTVDLLASALELDDQERARFLATSRGRRDPAGPGQGVHPGVRLRPVPPLVGRGEAIAGVGGLLDRVDLVTLVGLSGIGKTSLALAVGHEVADRFPGGVGGATVTEASTESEVLASAAASLGAGRVDDLPDWLASRRSLLVVFGVDRNPEAGKAAISWLRGLGSGVRVLATSRYPLKLQDEHEWPVLPLDVPPPSATGAEVFSYPATALFLDRLRRVRSRPVELAEAATLGALVRRLGGVPLAVELAAARGRVLELEEMLARYGGTAPADLRGAVEASWQLLTQGERECLCWLAVFQWRWSVELAEALLDGHPAAGDVVALVDRVVGLGLVSVRPDAHAFRFWLLDAVREVALEQAREWGVLLAARERHAVVMSWVAVRMVADLDDRGEPVAAAGAHLDHLAVDVQAALDHLRGRDPAAEAALTAYISAWHSLRGVKEPSCHEGPA